MLALKWEGAEKEGERKRANEREKIPTGSNTSMQSPIQGLNPQTVRLWPELKPRVSQALDWAIQAPQKQWLFLLKTQRIEYLTKTQPKETRPSQVSMAEKE